MASAVCYGIDLGTTNSCIAIFYDDNRITNPEVIDNLDCVRTTPSVVSFDDKQVLFGKNAMTQRKINPKNTICNVKRLIGTKFSNRLLKEDLRNLPYDVRKGNGDFPVIHINTERYQDKNLTPEQISAFLLNFLKRSAERKCMGDGKVVITVPANFNSGQRSATMAAAKIAGLDPLAAITEPTAACIAHAYSNGYKREAQNVLVYDFGGGTLDVSLVKIEGGNFTVLATAGDAHCGGVDIDQAIYKIMAKKIKDEGLTILDEKIEDEENKKRKEKISAILLELCEETKRNLSVNEAGEIILDNIEDGKTFTGKLLRADIDHIINGMKESLLSPIDLVLEQTKMEKKKINEIILVGGSSNIPRVRQLLEEKLGNVKFSSINPDEVIAMGAAVYGAFKCNKKVKDFDELKIVDVTPMAIGFGTKNGMIQVAIPRNSPKPAKSEPEPFKSSNPNPKSVALEIYEGDSKYMKDCYNMAKYEIEFPKNIKPEDEDGRIFQMITVDEDDVITLYAYFGKSPKENIEEVGVKKFTKEIYKIGLDDSEITEMKNQNMEMMVTNEKNEEKNYKNITFSNIISIRTTKASFSNDRETKKRIDRILDIFKRNALEEFGEGNVMNVDQFQKMMKDLENQIKEICPGYIRPKKFEI